MSTTGYFSNYLGNLVLTKYLTTLGAYLALHTSDPTVLGNLSTEVVGGSYVRQHVTLWTSPSSKTTANNELVVFDNLPACTVTYMSLWTAVTAGNMLWALQLGSPIVVVSSARIPIPVNDFALTV